MWTPKFPATLVDPSTNRESLFVVQAWHELLLPTSPDSFQCRTLDLPLLLEDALHVALMALRDRRWQAYLDLLAAELELLMEQEERILQADRRLRYALDQVLSCCKKAEDPTRLCHTLEIAIGEFGDAAKRFTESPRVP